MDERILHALALSALAGLSTGLGGAVVAFAKGKRHTKLLAGGLGLSGGVMVYVSFVELFPDALERIGARTGETWAQVWTALAFFGGMGLIALIDMVVPEGENPHDAPGVSSGDDIQHAELRRLGVLTAIAVGVHNFPEGFATFVSSYEDWRMGLPIAAAVGLHNIPEGIAIAVPVLFATGDPKRAFWWSLLSGLAEPIGAILGWVALGAILDDLVMGVSLAAVAGIMVFISLDQLIPNSRRYDAGHVPVYGLVVGMGVMAATLALL